CVAAGTDRRPGRVVSRAGGLAGAALMIEGLRAFRARLKGWDSSIAVAVIISIALRSYLTEAFRIPSASMENTLLVGDFLFVNQAIYGGELEFPLTGIRVVRLPAYADPLPEGTAVARSGDGSRPTPCASGGTGCCGDRTERRVEAQRLRGTEAQAHTPVSLRLCASVHLRRNPTTAARRKDDVSALQNS